MKKSKILCMLIIAMLTFTMAAETTVLPVSAKTTTSTKKKSKSKKKSKKSTKKKSKSKKSTKKKSSKAATTPAATTPAAPSAPVAAAPAASAPVASAPAASAPAASAPAASAPAASTPQTEAPAAQTAPQTKTPAASAPAASAPAAKTPAASAPAASAPAASAPAASAPAASAPKASAPAASAPKTSTSSANTPAASTPKASAPATKAPAAQAAPQTEAQTEKASQTEVPAAKKAAETEHVCEFDWVVTKEPYCGYVGYDMTWRDTGEAVGTCVVCGKKKTKGLRKESHNFKLVAEETTATCEKGGTKTYKCDDCGYKMTETVTEALGHVMEHHEDAATCTEDGHSYDKCSRCGLVTNDVKTAEKLGHDFNVSDKTGYVKRQASCTQAGVIEIPCQRGCGATKTEYIRATGHQMNVETFEATCYANAKTVSTCSVCGYQETKEDPGTKLNHQMEAGVGEESTPTVHGYQVDMCTLCGYEERKVLPLATHNHEWTPVSKLGEKEGVLASMSGSKIRTERCTYVNEDGSKCNEMRYAYNIDGAWLPWENVPCNGKGHTWSGDKCEICGMTKPGSEGSGNGSHRIVWSVTIKTQVEGVCAIQPTTISQDNHIRYTAPEIEGYEFTNWTWSRFDSEIPNELFSDADGARRSLDISCEYMDVIFIANYRSKADEAKAVLESIAVDPEEMPSVIHGEMSLNLDVEAEPDEDAAAVTSGDDPTVHEVEDHGDIIEGDPEG